MSIKSKYPSRKLLIPAGLLAVVVVTGLGITSIAAGQVANTPIQNNVGISASQPSSPDNASDYFVLQSQQELFNAVNTGQAEEIFAKIGQAASEIKMGSITDHNITGTDGNSILSEFDFTIPVSGINQLHFLSIFMAEREKK
jgi:hypothetical protein